MTAVTAQLTPAADAVTLTVTGAPLGPLTLTRRDHNGVAAVRVPASLALTGPTVTVTDYEVALGGPVRYLVADASGAATLVDVLMPGAAGPQLRRTHRPDVAAVHGAAILAVLDAPASQRLLHTAHEVIGREDVVYTTGRLRLREGVLTILCPDLPSAHEVRRVYGAGQTVRLRAVDQDGLDMHHLGLLVALTEDATVGGRWQVAVTYAEIVPAATRTLAAWNLAQLAGTFATLGEVALTYATLDAVTTDDRPER